MSPTSSRSNCVACILMWSRSFFTASRSRCRRCRCRRNRSDCAASRAVGPLELASSVQGLTLVHFSAQRKRFLWDRGCMKGLLRGTWEVLRVSREVSGVFCVGNGPG